MKNRKKRLAVFVVLLILGTLILSVNIRDSFARTEITISPSNEHNEAATDNAIFVLLVIKDGLTVDLNQFASNAFPTNEQGYLFGDGTAQLTMRLSRYDSLEIILATADICGSVYIDAPGLDVRQTVDLYSAEQGYVTINIPFEVSSTVPLLLVLICVLLFTSGITAVVVAIEKNSSGKINAVGIITGLNIGLCIITSSYAWWDVFSKVLMVAVSILCCNCAVPKFINGMWREFAPTRGKLIVLFALGLWATFATTFNQIVLSTVPYKVGLSAWFYIISWLFFWVTCVFAFLRLLDWLQERVVTTDKTMATEHKQVIKVWLMVFSILCVCYSAWIYACWPGNVWWDTATQWMQAVGDAPLNDAHPIFVTMLLKISILINRSPATIVVLQTIIQNAIWATAATLLYRSGLRKKALMVMALIVGLNPANGLWSATVVKDMFFSIAMLGLIVSLGRYALYTRKHHIHYLVMLSIGIVFVGLTKTHSFVAGLATAVGLLFISRKHAKAVALIAIAVIILWKGAIVPYIVKTSEARFGGEIEASLGIGSIPAYAIASVFYNEGNFDDKTREQLLENVSLEEWVRNYHPYIINPYGHKNDLRFGEVPVFTQLARNGIETRELIEMYIKTFIRNPFTIIHHHLTTSELNWDVFVSRDPSTYRYRAFIGSPTLDGQFYPEFVWPSGTAATIASNWYNWVSSKAILDNLLNASGLLIIFYLLIGYRFWLSKQFMMNLTIIPMLANFAILMLVSVAQDCRYIWHVGLCFPLVFFYALVSQNKAVEGWNDN